MTTLRLPVRWRLTLWFAALLALVMALFGGTIYVALRQQLYDSFDEQLLNQAALTLAAVRVEDGAPTLAPSVVNAAGGEFFLRLMAADGTIVYQTGATGDGIPLDPAIIAATLAGRIEYSAAVDEDNEVVRLISVPVRPDAEGDVSGVLQVGLDRNEIDEPLAGLLGTLILAGPVVLLFATAGGYLLAGRALRPVATITDLAARIGAGDLRSRLNLDLPDDELGRLARTFDAMLARIDEAFDRQRRFTDDAAHELRTPLSLMRSQVDLTLARPRSTGEYREALQAFDGDIARMTSLVGTLLTLARSDAGQLATERALFDLANTVRLVLEQYGPMAEEAGLALRDETSPTLLVADEDLLMQLLINLIDNALAHTPPGGSVVAGCRHDDARIHFWVADTGEGMAAAEQDRVFDRFYRIDTGRSRDRGGTGLGLAICKAIAEAHGGTIGLSSRLGSGTRVEIVLPDGQPHA